MRSGQQNNSAGLGANASPLEVALQILAHGAGGFSFGFPGRAEDLPAPAIGHSPFLSTSQCVLQCHAYTACVYVRTPHGTRKKMNFLAIASILPHVHSGVGVLGPGSSLLKIARNFRRACGFWR